MKDSEISTFLEIPPRTLANWKISSDWRAKLYTYLSLKTVEEIKPEIERIEKILKMREEGKQ